MKPKPAKPKVNTPTPPINHHHPKAAEQPAKQVTEKSTFRKMAETAGAVAVGSTVGNVVGTSITNAMESIFSSRDGPCSGELKKFLECCEQNSGNTTSSCDDLSKIMDACKTKNNLK